MKVIIKCYQNIDKFIFVYAVLRCVLYIYIRIHVNDIFQYSTLYYKHVFGHIS